MNKKIFNKYTVLLLLASLFLIPIIAAKLLHTHHQQWHLGTTNYGYLIPSPLSITDLNFADELQQTRTGKYIQGYWGLFYLDPACSADCEQQVLQLHQLRLALAKESHRLKSVIATHASYTGDNATRMAQNSSLLHSRLDDSDVLQLTSNLRQTENNRRQQGLFIIDPLGNIIISYNSPFNVKRIYQDLKRLLKASQIG